MRPVTSRPIRSSALGACVLLIAASCGSPSAPTATPTGAGFQAPSIAVSVAAGDVIATGDATPWADSVIEGTAADGTSYRLEIPAFAVAKLTTISMRAVEPTSIQGGRVVAGVDLGPEGLTFDLPLTLNVTFSSADPRSYVPLQYSGPPGSATAGLASVKAVDGRTVQLWIHHFSGDMFAEEVARGSTARWDKVNALAATGDSPAEVIAWAQATLNAVAYDDDFGLTRDAATAREIAANAWDQWVNAELDKWAAANPGLEDRASKGAVADSAAFTDIVNELIAAAVAADQAQELLGDPNAATQSRVRAAFELDKTFLTKLADNLQSDRAFQKQLDGGLASDFDSVSEFVTLLTGAARRFLLVGDEALWTTFVPIVGEWIHRYGMTLAASCLIVPIRRDMATDLGHAAQLYGDADLESAMAKCVDAYDAAYGSPRPMPSCGPTAALQPATLVIGGPVAEAAVCAPATPGPTTGWRGTMSATQTWTMQGGYVGTATSTFDGVWTLDPAALGDCEETCMTSRPTGTVKWTWDAHYPKQGSSRPACNSTTSGSVEAATAVTFEASELDVALLPSGELKYWGSGMFKAPPMKCGASEIGADAPPLYLDLSENASTDNPPSEDNGTCQNMNWRIEANATTMSGSCVAFAYSFPGYSTNKLTYTWTLTRIGEAMG